MPAKSSSPRIWLVARNPAEASGVLRVLESAGISSVEVQRAGDWEGCSGRAGPADLVWFHGGVGRTVVRRWLVALGPMAQAVAVEGDAPAQERGVRRVSRASFERGGSALRTRLNLLAAEARDRRRTRGGRWGARGTGPPARGEEGPIYGDVVLFLGSSGAPEQLRHVLPSVGRPKVPVLLAVHHPPSQRTSFRSMLTRFAGGPMGLFTPPCRDLPPGMYTVPAPVGLEVPGPNLDDLVDRVVAEGLRALVCLGSGMGEEGVAGAARARAAGGRVFAVQADLCAQPSMVQAAARAGLVEGGLTLLEMAALWSRVVGRSCVANGAARRSPAA